MNSFIKIVRIQQGYRKDVKALFLIMKQIDAWFFLGMKHLLIIFEAQSMEQTTEIITNMSKSCNTYCVKMCMKWNKLKVTFPKLLLQLIDCHSNYDICNFANGFPLINQKDTHWIHSWDLCVVLCRTCVRCTWITFNYYLHLRFK